MRVSKPERKPWHTDEYRAYLESPEWAEIRREALERAENRCQWGRGDRSMTWCPETTGLEVHHRYYVRFGHEQPGDLMVLCRRHHAIADSDRQEYARRATLKRKYGDWRPGR